MNCCSISPLVCGIDGIDIRQMRLADLRGNIGLVPQDPVLFNDTIYYNISYGRPGATPAEIEAAGPSTALADLFSFLRYGVTIEADGSPAWWGYVHEIGLQAGPVAVAVADRHVEPVSSQNGSQSGGEPVGGDPGHRSNHDE